MKAMAIRGGRAAGMVLAVAALAVTGAAQGQTAQSTPRAATPAPAVRPATATQTAPAAQAAPFTTVPQVCQMREREIALVNSQLLLRNQALSRETDAARRAQITAPLAELRTNLRETEASWQRMDCVRLLYSR